MISRVLYTAAAVLALFTIGCGGGSRSVGAHLAEPKLPPANPEALKEFDAGMRALHLGGPDAHAKARPRLQEATRKDPTLWEAWHNLGVLDFQDANDEAAVEELSRALDINPASMSSHLARAEAARRAGDTDAAVRDYRVLMRERPTDRLAYTRLASLYRSQKKYEAGLGVIREALRVAGPDAQVYVELALIYLGQGREELAELVLRRAIALDDEQPSVHNAIALVLLARGKDQQAFERFDYATSLDPSYVDARFNAASVLLDAGDYPRAKAKLEELVAKDPGDEDAQVALGLALRGVKDYDGAQKVWEEVVRTAGSSSRARADALWNLAVLEADIKMEDDSAKRALDRYLQEAPAGHAKRKQAEERRKELGP